MTACEIQLRYVIRDKIQSETKSSLRQNLSKIFFVSKIFCLEKIVRKKFDRMLSQISSEQSVLSQKNRCLSSLSGIFIPQLWVAAASRPPKIKLIFIHMQ